MSARLFAIAAIVGLISPPARAADDPKELAAKAQAVFKTHCYRCHGQDGAIEGGLNYVADLGKLVARKKVVPGNPAASRLFKRIDDGTMPPPDEKPRPIDAEIAAVKTWIAAGAPAGTSAGAARRRSRPPTSTTRSSPTSKRWTAAPAASSAYFTLAHLHNAGLSDEELQTYRNALNKLVNSLSWGSKIVNPVADRSGEDRLPHRPAVVRLGRDDLEPHPARIPLRRPRRHDRRAGRDGRHADEGAGRPGRLVRRHREPRSALLRRAATPREPHRSRETPARGCHRRTSSRSASRAWPSTDRASRASTASSNATTRHTACTGGATTSTSRPRTSATASNGNLVPDPRNIFAFPLGPAGLAEFPFQHAGGEAIFALPNGLHAYYIANADNARLDKAPVAIVSDPKRPDRAVEAGVSCMSCHVTGILPKADQMIDHLAKNPKAFTRQEADLIKALYPGKDKVLKLMEEDAKQLRRGGGEDRREGVAVRGGQHDHAEVRGRPRPRNRRRRSRADARCDSARGSPSRRRSASHFGPLLAAGGTVSRQIWVQAFGDVTRELRLGTLFLATLNGATNQDNTGELDPLESRDGAANQMAFTRRRPAARSSPPPTAASASGTWRAAATPSASSATPRASGPSRSRSTAGSRSRAAWTAPPASGTSRPGSNSRSTPSTRAW